MAAAPLQGKLALPTSKFYEPKRIDWATSQSDSQDISEDVTHTKPQAFTTPPSKNEGDAAARSTPLRSILRTGSRATNDRVYDIATLLSYRCSLAGIGVFAKIKPEALAGQ